MPTPSITIPRMTIAGSEVGGERHFEVVNPATGEPFAQAPVCSPAQLDEAFGAALHAFPRWSADEDHRREVMLELAAAIVAAGDELCELLVLETGKPGWLAPVEIQASEAWLRYYAGLDLPRRVISEDQRTRIELRHRPLGVAAGLIPWNFPVGSAVWKLAPAIRVGCPLVLKPSPFAPLAVLRLGEILSRYVPPGTLSIVSGGDDLGAAMVSHPVPRKISLTGSIPAGKSVAIGAAPDLKRVTLELGGNDAAILLDDVDLEKAIPQLFAAATFNTGQVCAIPKRIFVPERMHDDAVDALADAARAVALGAGGAGRMGPLSTRPQYERVTALVTEAIADGAHAVTGGAAIDGPGFFFPPTVLTRVHEGQRIVDEEQFGPVLPVLADRDVDDAIARANSTMYGLCGSVWSEDAERAAALAERLECGVAYINGHGDLPPQMPFLGAKWSGLGVENGVDGLLEFTERQVVHTTL